LISDIDCGQTPGTSRPAASAQGSPKGAKAMFLIVLLIVVIIAAALTLRRFYH
jgi:4-hydroxybenzoate polyprenyltransferase